MAIHSWCKEPVAPHNAAVRLGVAVVVKGRAADVSYTHTTHQARRPARRANHTDSTG